MLLTIPLISTSSVLRILTASALLFPFTACRGNAANDAAASSGIASSAETPRAAYDFVNSIGLNTHLNYFDTLYGNFPLVERELKSIGVLHLRDGVHLQNSGYNAELYGRWIQLGSLGIRFNAVLDPRSKLGPLSGAMLDQVDHLAGHTIESFEGANEMDVSGEADWPSMDRDYQIKIFASVNAMKRASSIKVIGPSLAAASSSAELGNLGSFLDFGNLHPYPAGQMPSVVFPDEINLEKVVCDGKTIDFTESGYHNAIHERHDQPGVSEAAAAKYIPRLFLEDFMRGIPRTYLYEFMDEKPDPGLTDPQQHWGLIRADGSEKPAFGALKNLIAELSDAREPARLQPMAWTLSTSDPRIHHLLLQKSDGTYDLVLWQEISSYDVSRRAEIRNPSVAATLKLGQPASSIAIYDPVMHDGPVKSFTHTAGVLLEISDHPLVLAIHFE